MNATIIKRAAVIALVFTPVLAMAQWKVGIEGGVVRNTLLASKCYDYDRHYTGGTNGIIGIPVRYDFRDWFGIQAEVSYLAKDYSMYRSEIFEGNYYNYTNSYLNIPIYARFVSGARNCADMFLPAASSERGWTVMWKATSIDISSRMNT